MPLIVTLIILCNCINSNLIIYILRCNNSLCIPDICTPHVAECDETFMLFETLYCTMFGQINEFEFEFEL